MGSNSSPERNKRNKIGSHWQRKEKKAGFSDSNEIKNVNSYADIISFKN